MNEPQPEQSYRELRIALRIVISIFLAVVVLVLGGLFAMWLYESGPKADRQRPPRRARRVEVEPMRKQSADTLVDAWGTVKPARQIALHPRVGGQVIDVSGHLEPGGLIKAGETILQIDKADFELRVEQRESEVAQARADERIELGQQSIAQREFELLGESIIPMDRDLVLRQPQLQTVQAKLKAAEAALKQAKLDRQRTTVVAPFNTMIQSRQVNLGSYISTNSTLAMLVGTDRYWIEVAVPVGQLKWISVPGPDASGSAARVYNEAAWGPGVCREGKVVRLAGDLEGEGRMARLLVAVDDPLGLASETKQRLLLNSYVDVKIAGKTLNDVIVLDRRHLHDGDNVWLMEDGKLAIRPVEVIYRGRNRVFISGGLDEGDQVIVTNLSSAVEGMALRTADAPDGEAGPRSGGPTEPRGAGAAGGKGGASDG